MGITTFLHAGLLLAGVAAATPKLISRDTLSACASQMDDALPYDPPPNFQFSGNVRRFYVAAEEVEWDYAPTGWDNWLGVPIADSPRAKVAGALTYGTKWLKAQYIGYTDATFTNKTEQAPYQGIQGPTLRAEVGDMIEILFVNEMTENYATMHSMGLSYDKGSDGADMPNNTMPGQNVILPISDAVPPVHKGVSPGECVVYKWLVDSNNGPRVGEPAVTHSYHSYVSLQEDTNAGLIGPTFIYASGQMASTMSNYREIPLLYMYFDESLSFLADQNAAKFNVTSSGSSSVYSTPTYTGGNQTVSNPQLTNFLSAQGFTQAPRFASMNGYIFANNPTFNMCNGDKVIWYVNGYGAASHVFHMHGSGFSYLGVDNYAESINDGVGKTLYMTATALGKWQVICHVNNHQSAGMVADYQIWTDATCPLTPLGSTSSSSSSSSSSSTSASVTSQPTSSATGGFPPGPPSSVPPSHPKWFF